MSQLATWKDESDFVKLVSSHADLYLNVDDCTYYSITLLLQMHNAHRGSFFIHFRLYTNQITMSKVFNWEYFSYVSLDDAVAYKVYFRVGFIIIFSFLVFY